MSTPDTATWDPWDPETLARCESCGGKLVRVADEAGLRLHVGHRLHDIQRLTLWEFFKVWVGVL